MSTSPLDPTSDWWHNRCASCAKKARRLVWIACAECGHPYMIPRVGLVLHDWRDRLRYYKAWRDEYKRLAKRGEVPNPDFGPDRWNFKTWLRAHLPRRYSKIYSCPCCVHDL